MVNLAVHPQRPASEFENVHMHMYVCIIRQEVTKWGKQSGGDSELKIAYRWTDYHNKAWGKMVSAVSVSMCGNEEVRVRGTKCASY